MNARKTAKAAADPNAIDPNRTPRYYAYLRVSRDSQDTDSQELGLLHWANGKGWGPLQFEREIVGRSKPWEKRAIGTLLTQTMQPGDYLLAAEFSRLAGSPTQVFTLLACAAERKITVAITKNNQIMDGSLNAQIHAAAFGIASMVEVEFLRLRTREGLERARAEGRIGGRKKGTTGKLKLDPRIEEVRTLYDYKISARKLADIFKVTEKTMRKFIARHFKGRDAV